MQLGNKSITIKQLRYFLTVAETLNYRRAAQQLGISQPALTTQITALEEALGLSLLERSRAGTQLSPAGRNLLPHARQVLLSLRGFEEAAGHLAEGHHVTYRLGVPPTVGPYLLPYVLPEIHQRYQALKLYVREDSPRGIQQGLVEGRYDLAIVPLPLVAAELAMEPLFSEPLKFVISSEHPLAGRELIKPSQLRGEKVLTLEDQHHFHHQVQDICERLGALVLRDYEGTSLDTLRQMVVMGLGVAFLPGLYVHSELHHPEALQVCEIKGMSIRRQHALVWRASAPNRAFFRELASTLRTLIANRLAGVVAV